MIKDHFFIQCQRCKSEKVNIIVFGYNGEILVYCENCENEVVI